MEKHPEPKKLKNLSNCKPTEFIVQTGKIAKSVENWLFETDILNIIKKSPKLEIIPPDATDDQKDKLLEKNEKAIQEQAKKNIFEVIESVTEKHPEESTKVLAMCCFIAPESIDDYQTRDLLASFTEMIGDPTVLDFFSTLVQLEQMFTGEG